MDEVRCPGCGDEVSLAGVNPGDRIDCPNCANLTVRLVEKNGSRVLEQVHKVSCPRCDRLIEVSEGSQAGDAITCCGQEFTLTYDFGTFALAR
jgi:endogenous inhibitor of DNA gyrase (YacG/DUF329 family)